jgi:hypothetical protein
MGRKGVKIHDGRDQYFYVTPADAVTLHKNQSTFDLQLTTLNPIQGIQWNLRLLCMRIIELPGEYVAHTLIPWKAQPTRKLSWRVAEDPEVNNEDQSK